jgi:hypothetical protein
VRYVSIRRKEEYRWIVYSLNFLLVFTDFTFIEQEIYEEKDVKLRATIGIEAKQLNMEGPRPIKVQDIQEI